MRSALTIDIGRNAEISTPDALSRHQITRSYPKACLTAKARPAQKPENGPGQGRSSEQRRNDVPTPFKVRLAAVKTDAVALCAAPFHDAGQTNARIVPTKSRYALRAMIDLAEHSTRGLYPPAGDRPAAGDRGRVPEDRLESGETDGRGKGRGRSCDLKRSCGTVFCPAAPF